MEHRLLCCENASVELDMKCKAYSDPVFLKDKRVLDTLLNTEERYMPNSSYFSCVQTDVEPYMREMVAHWMLDVSHEERREEEVFTLAMNLLDRFLSLVHLKRQHLQLLGTVCLLLASKLKENPPVDIHRLVKYSDNAFTLEELKAWELVVLSRLKWDLSAITPHAFLDQILDRLHLDLPDRQLRDVREVASYYIKVCATDARFTSNTPSMVAAAALASAINKVLYAEEDCPSSSSYCHPSPLGSFDCNSRILQDVFLRLHHVTQIDIDSLKEVFDQIEKYARSNSPDSPSTSVTPTDVQDVCF